MRSVILISLLFAQFSIFSQDKYFSNFKETQKIEEKVIDKFIDDKVSAGLNIISDYWVIPQSEQESFKEKTIKYLNIVKTIFGEPKEAHFIKEEKIPNFNYALRRTYIVRYEKSAVVFKFTYFRNENGWFLNAFNWDSDDWDLEFE